jgi:xanthine dehydrogenase YagR molybdenum-binding subunit
MFFTTGHRPRTSQRVALGAAPDGKLVSLIHEGTAETSRYEEYVESLLHPSSFLYACPNARTRYRLKPLDLGTPTYMRAPGEASGVFALESAMDELAYALELDPVELRRKNEPEIDEGADRPFSSRSMLKCYDLAADRFGWSRRDPRPGAMRDGRLLIGQGMAASTYPVMQFPAGARVRLLADGSAEVEAAASDMGPGTYTSMTQVAAEALGLPVEKVRVSLGSTDFPPTPPHGGSMTMASVGSAILNACLAVQAEAAKQATAGSRSPFSGAAPKDLAWSDGRLFRPGAASPGLSYAEIVTMAGRPIEATAASQRDPEAGARYSMHGFGAVFAEVAIDPDVATIRVRRLVGAYGVGRIVNPLLARSQGVGGLIGGMGMALMERTVLDPRDGRPVNAHMADYLVPVNLDTPEIEVLFVEEEDPHVNALGVKGLGEITLVGVAPAIANAVFHATGRRVRDLPIRIENLL